MLHGGFPLSWLLLCGVMTLKMNLLRQIAAKAYFCLTWVVPRIPKNKIKLCFSCQGFNTPSRAQILAASWQLLTFDQELFYLNCHIHLLIATMKWHHPMVINIMIKYKNLCLDTRLNICVLYVHKIRNIYAPAHKVIFKTMQISNQWTFPQLLINESGPTLLYPGLTGGDCSAFNLIFNWQHKTVERDHVLSFTCRCTYCVQE